MITNSRINWRGGPGVENDCSFGNRLFRIAGVIGVATNNGYKYGFQKWNAQEYFVNSLPVFNGSLPYNRIKPNYRGIDFGFCGLDFPDNVDLDGEFGSHKYFSHCEDLIRYYFTMKDLWEPMKDCILVHYRDYPDHTAWPRLTWDNYYKKALSKLPAKKVIVVTDNVNKAFEAIGQDFDYTSNLPIEDFYLLTHADYVVMANSTFSWWGAWLSNCLTVAPKNWFGGEFREAPVDLYLPNWITV